MKVYVVLLFCVVVFVLTGVLGYLFASGKFSLDDFKPVAIEQVSIAQSSFDDVSILNDQQVNGLIEQLKQNSSNQLDKTITSLSIERASSPLNRESYQLFQAADPDDPKVLTMGCTWTKNAGDAVIELYLDDVFLQKIEQNAELTDTTLRGIAYCITSVVAKPTLSEEEKTSMLLDLLSFLKTQGWGILE
jgi:hypothetical protein